MRPIFIFLLVIGAAIIIWLVLSRPAARQAADKTAAIAVSKHSQEFNRAVTTVMNGYYQLSENFVAWDSVSAKATAAKLTQDLDNLPLEELKKDSTAIYETAVMFIDNTKSNAAAIADAADIREQREAFSSFTDNFYQFLNTIQYDKEVLYLQECPMAFDDTQAAQWLSGNEEIRNPYLGLYHPRYGKGMLHCGETKTTLNHTGVN